MGGGDLNAKKAWHPNTLKNQERVWKAEQAAAEEKKRIVELEKERQLERERANLNKLARGNVGPSGVGSDDRLHWMYEKPDKKVQQEEYLLGKAIDKNHDPAGKSEVDEIPAVSRRVVGSSMLTISGDTQVDLARKMREDPLLLVKERERAARAALLNNPVQRARLAELLRKERKEQESKKEGKPKKNKKKSKDLDNMLAEKLQSLSGNKGIDLASLLVSDDSSSDCSDTKVKKKNKKKKTKKKTKRRKDSSSDRQSESEEKEKTKVVPKNESKKQKADKKRRATHESGDESCSKKKKRSKSVTKRKVHLDYDSSDHQSSDNDQPRDKHTQKADNHHSTRLDRPTREEQHFKDERYLKSDRQTKDYCYRRDDHSSKVDKYERRDRKIRDHRLNSEERPREDESRKNYKNDKNKGRNQKQDVTCSHTREGKGEKKIGMSEEEKAAKLAEMAAAGIEREKQRERRVAQQLKEIDKASQASTTRPRSRNVISQLPDSLESRIHSNRHYIQRDQRHMNEHFARR